MAQEKISILDQKRIILGVSGSIAVYKAIDLASKLTQAGAAVDVIMTESAQRFVTPLAFQAVTGRPVYTDMWQPGSGDSLPTHIAHVGLGEGADLFVIAPATAHTLSKLAHGQADNLLSLTAIAARCPLLIAPAMDGGMYDHPATLANRETLAARGVQIIEPEEGRFASGLVGKGRLPETATLIGHVRRVLGSNGPLKGRKVLISAGGTREAIDPVRYISNRSSGKQGHALAQAAIDAGANVTLISSADDLPTPIGATRISVDSAAALQSAILAHRAQSDLLIMAAAVADYRPTVSATQKIKKTAETDFTRIDLTPNDDILLVVKALRDEDQRPQVVVGFAAESENLLQNAEDKRQRKGLDLLVANDISAPDAGFEVDTNRVVILDAAGAQSVPLVSKSRVSEIIISRAAELLQV
jgi:phosphopantothenoylcysteine decarboxylase/phosphopantothenate--cysteine ligase